MTGVAYRSRLERGLYWFLRHWLLLFNVVWGVYVVAPISAPLFMNRGMTTAAQVVYTLYSTQCHQLPERSYFLFGDKVSYSLDEIDAARGSNDNRMFELRKFIGTEQMGWKVAWSDRMISLWTSIFVASLVYAVLRKQKPKHIPVALLLILLLPMAVDGSSHFVADILNPVGAGFRDSNDWLRQLTGGIFSNGFYRGDAVGSFNSLMRLITGVVAGAGIAGFVLPLLDGALDAAMHPVPHQMAGAIKREPSGE